jgi:hypothetical protein
MTTAPAKGCVERALILDSWGSATASVASASGMKSQLRKPVALPAVTALRFGERQVLEMRQQQPTAVMTTTVTSRLTKAP